MKFFVAAIAAMVASANGQYLAGQLPLGQLPLGQLPLQYAQPINLGQPLAYGAAPLAAPYAAPLAAAPIPVAPTRYNVPAPYDIPGPAKVAQVQEKVEQHGYKIKF